MSKKLLYSKTATRKRDNYTHPKSKSIKRGKKTTENTSLDNKFYCFFTQGKNFQSIQVWIVIEWFAYYVTENKN